MNSNNGNGGWFVCVPCTKTDSDGMEVLHPLSYFASQGIVPEHYTKSSIEGKKHQEAA
jgi:hypothetical protein